MIRPPARSALTRARLRVLFLSVLFLGTCLALVAADGREAVDAEVPAPEAFVPKNLTDLLIEHVVDRICGLVVDADDINETEPPADGGFDFSIPSAADVERQRKAIEATLEGVPELVAARALGDWLADLDGKKDPDPTTDRATPLEVRIVHQAQRLDAYGKALAEESNEPLHLPPRLAVGTTTDNVEFRPEP